MPNKIGRPTKYTPELLELARLYVDGAWEEVGPVPTVVGLAVCLGIQKSTCYAWAQEEDKVEFSDILTRVEQMQEMKLIDGGLRNAFNPAITKMMMTKHGYSDKQISEIGGFDGQPIETKVTLDCAKLSDAALKEIVALGDDNE